MVTSTWEELIHGLSDEDPAKLSAYRDFCHGLPDVQERISTSHVA